MYKKSNKPAKKSAPHSKPAPQSQPRSASQSRPQSAPQQSTPKPQPASAWAKEDDMKKLTESLTYFIKASGHRFENSEKAIKDHEARILALEDAAKQASKPASASVPQSKPQQPAAKPAQQPASAPSKPKTSAYDAASAKPRRVFMVWNHKARMKWPCLDIFDARQCDPDYEIVRAWVDADGHIGPLLTEEEIRRYCCP